MIILARKFDNIHLLFLHAVSIQDVDKIFYPKWRMLCSHEQCSFYYAFHYLFCPPFTLHKIFTFCFLLSLLSSIDSVSLKFWKPSLFIICLMLFWIKMYFLLTFFFNTSLLLDVSFTVFSSSFCRIKSVSAILLLICEEIYCHIRRLT